MRSSLAFITTLLLASSALAQTVQPVEPIRSAPLVTTPGLPYGPAGAAATTTVTTTTTAPTTAPVMQAAPSMGMGLGKVFDEADTNRDNVVTREEFVAKANVHFGVADKNKDNKITREEMQAQQSSVMQQMQQNLFGSGGGSLGTKIDQFIGVGQPAPAQFAPRAPVAPVVPAPTAPAMPRTY